MEIRLVFINFRKKVMKTFAHIFFLFISVHAMGQAQLIISGKITDLQTGDALPDCFINIRGTECSTISDKDGSYRITCNTKLDKLIITCEHFNYENAEKTLDAFNGKRDKNIMIHFQMKFLAYELGEISITSAPDTVWGSKELNVADFAFMATGMMLLTYEAEERWKRQEDSKITMYRGCRLVLLDSCHHEIARANVPGLAEKFYTDFFDKIFLVCHEATYLVTTTSENITLSEISEEDFSQRIRPVVDSIGTKTYYSNYNKDYPAFDYMYYDNEDSSSHTFRHMINEEMMVMFRSEYKYLDPRDKLEAWRFEINTGIDKEVVAAYMRGFQNTYYYEPLNTPLLASNDTLLIFDHHHNQLIRLDDSGHALDSLDISYHNIKRPERWSKKIIMDKGTEEIYTSFEKNGLYFIRHIETGSGKTQHAAKLSYKYVDCIRIMNNEVYYIYRPFESSQNRFLYKEKLRSS